MKRLILFFIFISLYFCYANGSQDLSDGNDISDLNNNELGVFRIYDANGTIGTSFFYKYQDKNLLLTAAHNVIGLKPKKFYIDINDSEIPISNFLHADPELDFALLEIEDFTILDGFVPLKFQEEIISDYCDIFCLHFSVFDGFLEKDKIKSVGNLITIKDDLFYATLNVIEKGASGAPIIAADSGNFIGIVTNRINNNQQGYTGLIYGISSEKINNTIKSIFIINS